PIGGLDVFDYVGAARIWLVHQQNPFVHVMIEHSDDLFVAFMGWPKESAAYGGLWLWLSAPAAWLPGVLAPVFYFKVLALVAFGADLLLIRAIAQRIMPKRRLAAAVLFGWNPLVLLETTANGHND